ncbi:hypothetical protein D5086_016155 [Populus alba]|uniref:Uncharacterized protein n=1 Tax=Populus alba TaxID=43335 RepID=A0ACC4BVA1_POPAL
MNIAKYGCAVEACKTAEQDVKGAAVNSLLAVQDSKVGRVPRAYMASGVLIACECPHQKLVKTARLS